MSTYGTGADGDITISGTVDITDVARIAGRVCEDAKQYPIQSFYSNDTVFLHGNVLSDCLVAGDEVMIMAMQSPST